VHPTHSIEGMKVTGSVLGTILYICALLKGKNTADKESKKGA